MFIRLFCPTSDSSGTAVISGLDQRVYFVIAALAMVFGGAMGSAGKHLVEFSGAGGTLAIFIPTRSGLVIAADIFFWLREISNEHSDHLSRGKPFKERKSAPSTARLVRVYNAACGLIVGTEACLLGLTIHRAFILATRDNERLRLAVKQELSDFVKRER